jgi:hypothetical protein
VPVKVETGLRLQNLAMVALLLLASLGELRSADRLSLGQCEIGQHDMNLGKYAKDWLVQFLAFTWEALC